jgi:hypothetical protein
MLLIFVFFMFVALLFTKNHQKPRKSTKNNKPRKSCDVCDVPASIVSTSLFSQEVQLMSPSTIEEVSQVVVEEEVLVEIEATNEIIFVNPPLPSQQQEIPLQSQQAPPLPSQQQQTPLQSQQAPPLPSLPQQLQSQQAPTPPSQQQQTSPQPRRSSRLAGKPPVDFRPFF